VETDRPIFANRDGVKLYDWNQLTDRRTGYAWFGTEPGSALKKYDKWVKAR
jgi:PelA/Pel-15E family pectate lyase